MIAALTDPARAAALCAAALDLPEDSAEATALVERLFTPPAGRQTVRLATADDSGLVFGSVSDTDPTLGYVDLIAVRPGHRRRGLGRALLTEVEGRLAALGVGEVRLSGNAPCYPWPGIDVRYTAAICAAGRLGYQQTGTAWNMTADLTAPDPATAAERARRDAVDEERLAAAGVTVTRAGGDLPSWVRGIWGDGWAWEVGQSLDRPGAGCYVATRDGETLGFAAYGANRASWFGPMGTAPSAEGLGVGRVLLRRCLDDQRADGHTSAQISWAGPIAFYSRAVGARLERIFWQYAKKL